MRISFNKLKTKTKKTIDIQHFMFIKHYSRNETTLKRSMSMFKMH